jgi:hypothetical protein
VARLAFLGVPALRLIPGSVMAEEKSADHATPMAHSPEVRWERVEDPARAAALAELLFGDSATVEDRRAS